MRVCSLASSSKGNCTAIYGENEILLVDMGITLKDLEEKFERLKLSMENIIGVLISHEHSDHTKGILSLVRKYDVPIYCHYDSVDGVLKKTKISSLCVSRFADAEFKIGNFKVSSFKVCHDVCCVGYNISENSNKISIVTDLGHTTKAIVERLYDSRLVILEANHDEKMVLASTKYPPVLKQRILSDRGHLSNISSAKVVLELAQHNVRQVLFAHLSEENNTPALCYSTICDYLQSNGVEPNVNIKLDIAKPNGVGPIFVIN
ncbi:MAG: MBL fold metallo-hydrolase [Clostridia bacterium]|nr:MBL fold metallo-hydrolase [Clostridia bacterium]